MNYYNDNDKFNCAWLRELIERGHIPIGDVDERDIKYVKPGTHYTQCHFFAGIGGWSYALRLAGWPDNRPVWTGSCPCQPFSQAGKRKVDEDERDLWPAFRDIIAECRPPVCFGEQVAGKDGRIWLARVRTDLEALGYAVGAADLCAAGVGSPHQRQRLYWVADANKGRRSEGSCAAESPASTIHTRQPNPAYRLGHTAAKRLEGKWSEYQPGGERCSGLSGRAMQTDVPQWNGPTIAVECSDGPRRISSQPNAFPVAHGVPSRMVKLRGGGNAIVPQLAAEFIKAFQEVHFTAR